MCFWERNVEKIERENCSKIAPRLPKNVPTSKSGLEKDVLATL